MLPLRSGRRHIVILVTAAALLAAELLWILLTSRGRRGEPVFVIVPVGVIALIFLVNDVSALRRPRGPRSPRTGALVQERDR